MNTNWFWQKKQDKKESIFQDAHVDAQKQLRKAVRRALEKQWKPGKHTHIMDEEMFESAKKMLTSVDNEDIELARTIIFNSKIPYSMITKFANEYAQVIMYGPAYHFNASASLWI